MKILNVLCLLLTLCACTPVSTLAPAATPAAATLTPAAITASPASIATEAPFTPTPASTPNLNCGPKTITVPTLPAEIPLPNALDETTGLHVTGDYQLIDLETYRLKVSGRVDQPLSLTFAELRCLPQVTDTVDLVCPGFFNDRATWSGVPIVEVLRLAGVQADIEKVIMVSADGYQSYIPAEDALNPKNFLAYEMGGEPLPILHGFPVRAVFPGQIGGWWVKWLVELIVL